MSLLDRRPDREIDAEIAHHLEELVDLLVEKGWEPEAARREAARRFGDAARIRAELSGVYDTGGFATWVRSLFSDVRYAVRGLRARPTFTVSVVATLALGLGAAASIFAVVDALLLRPLPYRDGERWFEVAGSTGDGGYYFGMDAGRLSTWQQAMEGVADAWVAFVPTTFVRTDGPEAEALTAVAVTPGAERLLGIPLLMGRGFTGDDALPGAPAVAMLSRAYWERMGADPNVLGTTLRTEIGPLVVVGVFRDGTRFPASGPTRDVWVPIQTDLTFAGRPVRRFGGVWARLAPSVTQTAAQARADALAPGLAGESPSRESWPLKLVHVAENRANPNERRAIWTLAATVAAIFLIALVNGISLTLVRASTRLREIGVRLAIGGSRLRLLRNFILEGALLGILGGAASLVLAWTSLALLRGLLPDNLVWFSPHAFTVEARTSAFIATASLAAGLALGLLPAVGALRDATPATALAGRGPEDHPGVRRFRGGLVMLQVALTTMLLVVAGLLSRSMVLLLHEDPGYDVARLAVATVSPSSVRYPDAAARWALARRLEEALEARPEIEAVTVAADNGLAFGVAMRAEGSEPPVGQPQSVPTAGAAPDYVAVTGARLVEGRGFDASDEGTDHVVVDRDLARFLWPDGSAVGRRFRLDDEEPWMTVIGVLADLRLFGRDQRDGPYQFLTPATPAQGGSYLDFTMRTSGDPRLLPGIFRETLREIDPEQWIASASTAADSLADSEQTPRFLLTVMVLLAGIATVLSAVGLYGILAYSVARRQRELGIRMALGADRARLRGRVLREGVTMAGVGLLLGMVGALTLSRLVSRLLYQLDPADPTTYAGVAVTLGMMAVLASTLPALRATRVDPVEVLKAD